VGTRAAIGVFAAASAACFPTFPDDCIDDGCPQGSVCVVGAAGPACRAGGGDAGPSDVGPRDGGGNDGFVVRSTDPAANAVAGDPDVVSVTFSAAAREADASSFVARSSLNGRLLGRYGGGGTTTLTFEPETEITAGARIELTVRSLVESTRNEPLASPHVVRFWAGTASAELRFTEADAVEAGLVAARSIRLAQLDGDPDLELVFSAGATLDGIRIADIAASGAITIRSATLRVDGVADFSVSDLEVGDLNDDGAVDIFVASPAQRDGTRAFLGDPDNLGQFTLGPVSEQTLRLRRVRLGDLDGDGDLDFAGTRVFADQPDDAGTNVVVGLGSGDGTFELGTPLDSKAGTGVANELDLADMDADGDLDVVVLNDDVDRSNGTVVVLFNDGSGRFGFITADPLPAVERANDALVTGDFDGDGDVDVVVGSRLPGVLTVLKNDGRGALAPQPTVAASVDYLAAGDIDGDGDLDIVTSSGGILENAAGDGVLVGGASIGGTGLPALGDLDGDEDLDAVFVGESVSTRFGTYLND
jgi:hypothetical protein